MTRFGRSWMATSIGLILLGWLLGPLRLIWLGTVGLAVVALVRLLLGTRPVATLALERPPVEVLRGELAVLEAHIDWRRRGSWPVELELHFGEVSTQAVRALAPGRRTSVSVQMPTQRRGMVDVPEVSLEYRDHFGFFAWRIATATGLQLLVLPNPLVPDVSVEAAVSAVEARLDAPGDETTFALRDYVLGDEPRRIHWRSSARLGHLVVREHVGMAAPVATILLDDVSLPYRDGAGIVDEALFDTAVELAAGVLVLLRRKGISAALVSTSGHLHRAQPADFHAMCRRLGLADLHPGSTADSTRRAVTPEPVACVLAISPDLRRDLGQMGDRGATTVWLDPRQVQR